MEDGQHAESLNEGFEDLFESYYPRVSGFFSRRGFSAEESQDLAQKTFLKVYRGWERHCQRRREVESKAGDWEHYRRQQSPRDETSWLFTIALNTYRNEIRRRSAQKRLAAEKPLDELRATGWEPSADSSGPEDDYLDKQRVELLAKTVDELPPSMRRCFELRFAHGLKYQDIASVLKISIQSVRSQLHHARKRLEDLLSGH